MVVLMSRVRNIGQQAAQSRARPALISIARLFALSAILSVGLSSPMPATRAYAVTPDAAAHWNSPAIDWQDMASGVKQSAQTGKTVIMLMQASWCQSCKRYREVWKDPAIVEASKNFVMILIDVDKEPEVNSGFSPDGTYVPRTLFLNAEGEVLSDLRGSDPQYPHSLDISSPAELLSLMTRAAGKPANPPTQPHVPPDRRAEN